MRHTQKRMISAVIASALVLQPLTTTFAANNSQTFVSDVQTNKFNLPKIQEIDFVVNVDWDYDTANPPCQAGNAPAPEDKFSANSQKNALYQLSQDDYCNGSDNTTASTGQDTDKIKMTKKAVTALLNQTAQSIFAMTDGLHRVRKFIIYKNNKFNDNVDIKLINRVDRSYAHVATYTKEGSSFNFLAINPPNDPRPSDPLSEVGKVVAHELGHYFYAMYDEYAQGTDPSSPSSPLDGDDAKKTIMNSHTDYKRLSVASDYLTIQNISTNNPKTAETAQSRIYSMNSSYAGASAWETLTRDPASDGTVAKSAQGHDGRRVFFEAFRNYTIPTADQADARSGSKTTVGSLETMFLQTPALQPQMVFADSQAAMPRNVVLINRAATSDVFTKEIEAAKAFVRRDQEPNTQTAVYAYPVASNEKALVLDFSSDATALGNAIGAITATTGDLDMNTAYTDISQAVAKARGSNDSATYPSIINLFTSSSQAVDSTVGSKARNDKITINVVALQSSQPAQSTQRATASNMSSLNKLAALAGGNFNSAKSSAEAAKDVEKASKAASGEMIQNLAMGILSSVVAKTTSAPVTFSLGDPSKKNDSSPRVIFSYDPDIITDPTKLTFKVTGPGTNASFTPGVASAGFVWDTDGGSITYTLPSPATTGSWNATVTNNGTTDVAEIDVDVQVVNSPVSLSVEVVGGIQPANLPARVVAKLSGKFPIVGATLTATVYDASTGNVVIQNLALLDDGKGGDYKANDGYYSASVAGLLGAGEYTAMVSAVINKGTEMYNPNQTFVNGSSAASAATPVGDTLTRLSAADFGIDSATTTAGVSSSGGGGCTISPNGNDASLVLLVLSALGAFWIRRRRSAGSQSR